MYRKCEYRFYSILVKQFDERHFLENGVFLFVENYKIKFNYVLVLFFVRICYNNNIYRLGCDYFEKVDTR